MTDFLKLVLGDKLGKKPKRAKKGKRGAQSAAYLKRRTTTKKNVSRKLLKYKRKGYTPKNRLK
jgi:hypothetical protein